MAPTSMKDMLMDEVLNRLGKRQVYYCNGYTDFNGNCNSRWNTWGRWVALAVIIVIFLILAFLCSCYNTRRRRRRGMAPMYGTGWMGGNWGNKPPYGPQYGNGGYYNNQPYNGGAAPPYEPPVPHQTTGTTFNSNDGYYGQNAYELQQPQSAYQPQRGGDPVYDAPEGPPPKKGGAIIR
ncbi:hypothetical protein L207DRAFT_518462 [Hyaloscypha variabilis F]|jgi:hypothetical protein|uniref:Uncharacterized protein n=1 Tax=Hyaloscypha variabilis (strain UAMH 11265 / GT02V1 / F) TaxID=1149755 RepID=A0A2J6R233_HYAVF|nr:hypothetical protein L207DRAFT_518462 [Hyaloscypha variabilis F]